MMAVLVHIVNHLLDMVLAFVVLVVDRLVVFSHDLTPIFVDGLLALINHLLTILIV